MTISKWKLYKQSFNLEVSSWMAYRLNFALFLIGLAIFNFFSPIVIYLIYSNNLSFPGWSLYEALLLVGTMSTVIGIEHVLTSSIGWASSEMIRQGTFDQMMIRPISPLKLLVLRLPDVDGLAEFAAGIMITLYAIYHLAFMPTFMNLLMYFIVIIAGVVLLTAFDIMSASANFFFVKANAIWDFFIELRMFARYPITIFGSLGYVFLTFIIPMGILSYYPAQAFLGRLAWSSVALLVLITILFFVISLIMWEFAMRKYTSAGG